MNFFIKAVIALAVTLAMGFLTFALVQPPGSRDPEAFAVFASPGVIASSTVE